jgi:hypothetical protein
MGFSGSAAAPPKVRVYTEEAKLRILAACRERSSTLHHPWIAPAALPHSRFSSAA